MNNEMDRAIENLRAACGFGISESATEAFLDELSQAVNRTRKERTASHRKGLCLDCQAALGGNLAEILNGSTDR